MTMLMRCGPLVVLAVATLILPFFGCLGYHEALGPGEREHDFTQFDPDGTLKDEVGVGPYTIRTYRDPDNGGSLEILHSGKCVWGQYGWVFQIGERGDIYARSEYDLIGGDLTGDGNTNLVVYEWSGGAHCCFTMQLFELTPELRLLAEINGRDSVPCFIDVDKDGVPEITLSDMSYAYFPGSFVSSPVPTVVLQWENDSYAVNIRTMRIPVIDMEAIDRQAQEIRNSNVWMSAPDRKYSPYFIPSDLFSKALNLMYGGHEDLGWEFINDAWTDKFPIDTALLEELTRRMNSSPYWRQVRERYRNTYPENSVQITE